MKNFLLSIFLLISIAAIAQEPIGVPTQNYNGTWARFGQYLSIDKGLLIPARDTNWIPKRAGALTFWGTDFWGYNGQRWKLVGTNVTQQVAQDTTTTWIYFDRKHFKGEGTIPAPITLSDSLLAIISRSADTAIQDIVGLNSNTLRVLKKTGYYDIVFGNGGSVTNVSAVGGYGVTATVSNPTTRPSIAVGLDSTIVHSQGYYDGRYLPLSGGSLTGTGGNGFIGFTPQSLNPTTPASGFKLFATSSGAFAWITSQGYSRELRVRAQTQNNIYYLQDKSYTLADSADVALKADKSGTITINGSSQTLGSNPSFTISGNAGTVTGGSITWPGTIYATPTTGTVSGGTLTFAPALTTQAANTHLAGPISGASATPTFRSLVLADLPAITTSTVTEGTNLYYTDTRARAAHTLTTVGASGAATYNSTTGVLNVPNYGAGGWGLTGNSINPTTDFLGTTSNNALRIKTNNTTKIYVDSTSAGTVQITGTLGVYPPSGTINSTIVGGSNGLGLITYVDGQNVALYNSQNLVSSNLTIGTAANLYTKFQNNAISVSSPTTNAAARASSILDLVTTSKGFTPPSMTSAQRDAIPKVITSVSLVSGGSGYTSAPVISIGASTTVASALPFVGTSTVSGGTVTSVGIIYGGGYTATSAAPTLQIGSGGGGTGASGTATLSYPPGLTIYCTDCTATDGSTGVMQTFNGTGWKNNW